MATSASIGHSTNRNPDTAGREAAGQALAALANPASLLLVFATAGYDPHVLIPAIASAFPNVPMAGCSAAGGKLSRTKVSTWQEAGMGELLRQLATAIGGR